MECPKCGGPMSKVEFAGVTVHRCDKCGGIWFDEFEAEKLRRMKGSEMIDTGDPKVGKTYNRVEAIRCPVDHVPMLAMADPQQHHIWFEGCPVCHGAFFDAGEFRDLKQETILDFFRDLVTKERK